MIKKFELSGVHAKLDKDTKDYALKKLGGLDKYAPAKSRESLHLEVKLKQEKAKAKLVYVCEAILFLPQDQITITTESRASFQAAIDKAEDKIKVKLHKYKDKNSSPALHRRLLSKFKKGLN